MTDEFFNIQNLTKTISSRALYLVDNNYCTRVVGMCFKNSNERNFYPLKEFPENSPLHSNTYLIDNYL